MKVIYDHQIFSLQNYGGISRYFIELSQHLSSLGVATEIQAPLYCNEYLGAGNSAVVKGIKVPHFRYLGHALYAANNMLMNLNPISQSCDIYHETYYTSNNTHLGGAKRVLTVYDMIHERYPHMFRSGDQTSINKKVAVERADHIICISESTRKDLIDLFDVPAHKTSVIYLANSLEKREVPGAIMDASRPYILYVGVRRGYKNFERLLSAFSKSNKLKSIYDLVCFGGGSFTPSEMALFSKLNLMPSQIKQMSGSDSSLLKLYSGAQCFVYPSLYEGFGIPPLEAMSAGCPVACSNVSSMPEVVGDAAYLFNPESEVDIQRALEEVLTAPGQREELISKGYQRVSNFSWQKCAAETLDVYKNVIEGRI